MLQYFRFTGAKVPSTKQKAPLFSFPSARFVVKLPKCHMDKPSDGVRLNAFNFGNVLFMFPFMMVSRLKISKGLDSPPEHKRRVLKSCGRGERCYLFWVIPSVNRPTRLR